jgi:hypothetical protein
VKVAISWATCAGAGEFDDLAMDLGWVAPRPNPLGAERL